MKVAIIGGGIVGLSTAYHLIRNGVEVTVVDKVQEGKATRAAAGIVCPWLSNKGLDWYAVARNGALYYPELISHLSEDGEEQFGYKMVGAMVVRTNDEELDFYEQKALKYKRNTPEVGEVSRLTSAEVKKYFPPLHDHVKALHVTGGARVDGFALKNALQRAAEKHGMKYLTGEATLIKDGNKVTGIQVDGNKIYADKVVVAAGAWTKELLSSIGIQIELEPQRGQIIHLTLPNVNTSDWPVIFLENDYYMLAFDDSRVVVGATREDGTGFDYRLTAIGVKQLLEVGLDIAPSLADSTLKEMRIGFRPMGPDQLPLLGEISEVEGLIIATGLGASGITMGPYFGYLAGEIALDRRVNENLSLFDPLRAIKEKA